MTRRAAVCAMLMLSAFAAACKTAPANGASSTAADSVAKNGLTSNRITADELAAANLLGVTAMEAVQHLRPGYLIDRTAGRRSSSQPLKVSVNGGELSAVSALSSIPVQTIAEIRYFTVGEAAQRFGGRASGPVILVTLLSH